MLQVEKHVKVIEMLYFHLDLQLGGRTNKTKSIRALAILVDGEVKFRVPDLTIHGEISSNLLLRHLGG